MRKENCTLRLNLLEHIVRCRVGEKLCLRIELSKILTVYNKIESVNLRKIEVSTLTGSSVYTSFLRLLIGIISFPLISRPDDPNSVLTISKSYGHDAISNFAETILPLFDLAMADILWMGMPSNPILVIFNPVFPNQLYFYHNQ